MVRKLYKSAVKFGKGSNFWTAKKYLILVRKNEKPRAFFGNFQILGLRIFKKYLQGARFHLYLLRLLR